MSNPTRIPSASARPSALRQAPARSAPGGVQRIVGRRPSISGLALTGNINPVSGLPKAQRTSKTTQKLVVLPSEPQTKPLPPPDEEDADLHGYETDRGVRDHKSAGERMSKVQREKAGFKRITAYCVADEFKTKLLASFLKREHNVQPRVSDEAMYVVSDPLCSRKLPQPQLCRYIICHCFLATALNPTSDPRLHRPLQARRTLRHGSRRRKRSGTKEPTSILLQNPASFLPRTATCPHPRS